MAYASTEQGVAALEVMVNITEPESFGIEYSMVTASIPDELVQQLADDALPHNWNAPIYESATQILGENWLIGGSSLGLLVPSATMTPAPMNILINPGHESFDQLVVESVERHVLDERLRALIESRVQTSFAKKQ